MNRAGGTQTAGYASELYAEALSEFGRPRELPRAGGWVLERPIANSQWADAMGCYPLFSCADWSGLEEDLAGMGDLASVTLVTDPFGDYNEPLLRRAFPDLAIPFKRHYMTDLSRDPESFVPPHHRRNVKRGFAAVEVEECASPSQWADEWVRLYGNLIERHSIKGLQAFSPASLRRQLEVPGLILMRASHRDETAGIVLWLLQNGVAYYHLGAYSEAGYETRSSYAIFWTSIELLARRGVRWLGLGAAAGLTDDPSDGLARFKRGWSTDTRTAYLCGRILNAAAYEELVRARGIEGPGYFPAYRKGEFS